MPWLALVPRKVTFVVLAALGLAGALLWSHHAGYKSGRLDEHLAAADAKIKAARLARDETARAVDSVTRAAKPVFIRTAALHDSVKVVDTTTLVLVLPGPSSTPVRVDVPPIVVRRIVQDSLSLLAKDEIIRRQAAQIKADTTVIDGLTEENETLRAMKAPVCGAKCKTIAVVSSVVVAGEVAVRIARLLKGGR